MPHSWVLVNSSPGALLSVCSALFADATAQLADRRQDSGLARGVEVLRPRLDSHVCVEPLDPAVAVRAPVRRERIVVGEKDEWPAHRCGDARSVVPERLPGEDARPRVVDVPPGRDEEQAALKRSADDVKANIAKLKL